MRILLLNTNILTWLCEAQWLWSSPQTHSSSAHCSEYYRCTAQTERATELSCFWNYWSWLRVKTNLHSFKSHINAAWRQQEKQNPKSDLNPKPNPNPILTPILTTNLMPTPTQIQTISPNSVTSNTGPNPEPSPDYDPRNLKPTTSIPTQTVRP